MEASNEFAATLEKRLQDVPCSDELNEIKKVVRELKLCMKMAQDRERAKPMNRDILETHKEKRIMLPNWLPPKSWGIKLLRSKLVYGL